jgi:hypothetical protein
MLSSKPKNLEWYVGKSLTFGGLSITYNQKNGKGWGCLRAMRESAVWFGLEIPPFYNSK